MTDGDPQRKDETKPRSAQPGGQQGAVMPPSPTGTPRWRRPAIAGGAVLVILVILLLVL